MVTGGAILLAAALLVSFTDLWWLIFIFCPTLVLAGGESPPFMRETAWALADVIPEAQSRILEGQEHNVAPEALAPVLEEFFKDQNGTRSGNPPAI